MESVLRPLVIVITDFNGFVRTRRCLQALQASEYRDFSVLVVDHGTSDETRLALAGEFPEVHRIAASSELWWTGATNCGIRFALERGACALMLINSDCYVSPTAIGEVVRLWRQNPQAIIAPRQRDLQSGVLAVATASSCFLLGFPTVLGSWWQKAPGTAEVMNTRLIIGGRGVIIPAEAFRTIGLFDEVTLPHYGADHDFYLRAARAGFALRVAAHALVDIDDTSSTLAADPARLTLPEFLQTLRSTRSHRNLRDVKALFRKHYPVPGLYWLGVAFYTGRYMLAYLVRRGLFLAGRR